MTACLTELTIAIFCILPRRGAHVVSVDVLIIYFSTTEFGTK